MVVALDVHKHETQAHIRQGSNVIVKRFRTRASSYRRALAGFQGEEVLIESVGMHRPVAAWLNSMGMQVHLVNVAHLPRLVQKNDRKDAKRLADFHEAGALPLAYLPPERIQLLRDEARHRRFLGQQSRRLRTKIMHDLQKHGHFFERNPAESGVGRERLRRMNIPEVSSSLNLLEPILQEIDAFQHRLEEESLRLPVAQLLCTIPGVAAYTAVLVLAEVGDFNRFEEADNVGAYAGLVSRQQQSGDHDRRGSITKTGNATLRWALVEAARNHVRLCPESNLSKRYQRLATTKGHKKALVATARQLATVMHAMVTRNTPFQVNP